MKITVKHFSFLMLGIVVLAISLWLLRHLDIDRCLDHGGKFDYQNGTCEGGY